MCMRYIDTIINLTQCEFLNVIFFFPWANARLVTLLQASNCSKSAECLYYLPSPQEIHSKYTQSLIPPWGIMLPTWTSSSSALVVRASCCCLRSWLAIWLINSISWSSTSRCWMDSAWGKRSLQNHHACLALFPGLLQFLLWLCWQW